MGGPMGGPMPGHMGGQMGGAPHQGGYAAYGGGYQGSYGAPAPAAANDPMWGYFTAIAGQVSVEELTGEHTVHVAFIKAIVLPKSSFHFHFEVWSQRGHSLQTYLVS